MAVRTRRTTYKGRPGRIGHSFLQFWLTREIFEEFVGSVESCYFFCWCVAWNREQGHEIMRNDTQGNRDGRI